MKNSGDEKLKKIRANVLSNKMFELVGPLFSKLVASIYQQALRFSYFLLSYSAKILHMGKKKIQISRVFLN